MHVLRSDFKYILKSFYKKEISYSKVLILIRRQSQLIKNFKNAIIESTFLLSQCTKTLFYLSQSSFALHIGKYYFGDILFQSKAYLNHKSLCQVKPSVKHLFMLVSMLSYHICLAYFYTKYKNYLTNTKKLKNNFHLKPDIRKLSGI